MDPASLAGAPPYVRRRSRWRKAAIAIATTLIVALVGWFARDSLFRAALEGAVALASDYSLHVGRAHLGRSHVMLGDIKLSRRGDPVLDAQQIDVDYSLRDLLPGSKRQYGLVSIDVVRPQLYVIRHKDGSFNIKLPQTSARRTPSGTPYVLHERVQNGAIELIDDSNLVPAARHERIENIQSQATVDTNGLTRYSVDAALVQDGRTYPLQVRARIDMAGGYAVHHISAPDIPLSGLGNFLINSRIAQMQQGDLRDLDVRFYSLDIHPGATASYHLAGGARLSRVAVKLDMLTQPLQNLNAPIYFNDDAITTPQMTGRIGTTPLRGAGGMYDFAKPKFRLAVSTSEDLRILHRDFNFLRTEPLAGRMSAICVLEGAVDDPLILADARAAHVSYRTIPVHDFRATIAYHNGVVFAGDVAGSVGGVQARVAGRFLTGGPDVDTEVALTADAPPQRMPYLDRIAPRATSHMTLVGAGTGLLLDAHGMIEASGGGQSVSGLFALSSRGVGELAPFSVRQPGGHVDGAFVIDREHGTSALWANASGLELYPGSPGAVLRGAGLPAFPPLSGKFDGQVAGVDVAKQLILIGRGRARSAVFAGVPIFDARANFAGPIENLALANIDARGEFGRFQGHGALRAPGFAFDGTLDGTLQGLRRWTGDIGASGGILGPVAIISNGTRTLVQTSGVALENAAVHGVGLRDLAGTFAVEPSKIVVYAAAADVSGGRAVARGDSENGIRLSTGGIDAARLHASGLPISTGDIVGAGDLRLLGSHAAPAFRGAVALSGAKVSVGTLDGSALLRYQDGTLGIGDASVALAQHGGIGLLAGIDGSIDNVGAVPRYDLRTHVAYADLGTFADAFHLPVPYLRGTLLGDVRLEGSGAAPRATGTLLVPQGSVNGMDFSNGSARVDVGRRTVSANGTVTVGTTRASFAGQKDARDLTLRIDADRADLADFNDFFPIADTLGGNGSFHASVAQAGGVTSSSGDVDFDGVRFRRFPLGRTIATWNARSGKVDASLSMHGIGGDLDTHGTIAMPQTLDPRKLLTGARLDLAATVSGADLNVWLPALGYAAPVLGRVNATVAVRGSYPALALDLNGDLTDGRIGAIPIDKLAVSAAAQGTRTQLRSVDLALAGVSMHGSGSLGFRPHDALAIDMNAHAASLRELIRRVTGRTYDLDGSADVHFALNGTLSEPIAQASFNVSPLRVSRLVIPSIVGSASIDHQRLALRDATMNLPHGTITLSGSAPLVGGPLGIPASLPLAFSLAAHEVGLDQFAELAPSGTKLQGAINGGVQVHGTVSEPRIVGEVDLTGGGYSGPFETQPITGVSAALAFGETSVQLTSFDATVGGGTVHGSGRLLLPNSPTVGAAYDAAFTLSGARVAFPGYGSARGDGLLWLRGAPPSERGMLGGDLTISDASIPLAAFLKAGALPAASPGPVPAGPNLSPLAVAGFGIPEWLGNLGLDMHLAVGDGVRIRSPILDIGGKGAVQIAGRLGDPSLDGSFEATPGGSLFLNRAFRLQEARVRFSPDTGITPTLFARATTQIAPAVGLQPIDVTVTASGVIPNVKLSYASNPPYDEATIVGLLFDATNLGASVGSLNAFAPSTNILLPPNAFQQTPSGTFALSQEAASLINAQFTARLLAPIEQGLGAAFGLSDLAINLAPTGSLGVEARRWLGRNVSALYGTSLSYPYRMTFGLESRPAPETSIIFNAFTQQGLYSFGEVKPDAYLSANPLLGSAADVGGTVGFTVNIQRRFK